MSYHTGRVRLTVLRSRLADVVTLTTEIWNVPSWEVMQPAGAGAEGAMASLTPWGIGLATAAPTRARRAIVPCILFDMYSLYLPVYNEGILERW